MALRDKAVVATQIAAFGDGAIEDAPARLRYDVALPGQLRNRRVIALDGLGLAAGDWQPTAAGDEIANEIGLKQVGGSGTGFTFDTQLAVGYFLRQARANGVPGDKVAELERFLNVRPTPGGESPPGGFRESLEGLSERTPILTIDPSGEGGRAT
jgi:hypothetical protein